MLLSEIVQEVKNIVQDSTFDNAIVGYVNEAFLQASGRVNLPDLKRIGIAATVPGLQYVSLAGIANGFNGRLSKLLSTTILRFKSLEDLVSWVSDQSRDLSEVGAVEAVALEGKTLWYFPSPATTESIMCVLFSNPTQLAEDEDTPSEFPEVCHRNIGVHGAAYQAFQIIEDGIESDKINTTYHLQMFERGITQLLEWLGKHKVHMITSTMNDNTDFTQTWASSFTRWENVK